MDFQIPKSINYHVEDGWHRATLAHISYDPESKGTLCSCGEKARFTFHIDSNPRDIQQDAAARTFCMGEHGEDLLDFLSSWFGSDLQSFINEKGAVDLSKLLGQRAWILIQHKMGTKAKHQRPFCKIASIRPMRDEVEHEEAA